VDPDVTRSVITKYMDSEPWNIKIPLREIANMSVVAEIRDTSKIKKSFLIKFENTKPKTYAF